MKIQFNIILIILSITIISLTLNSILILKVHSLSEQVSEYKESSINSYEIIEFLEEKAMNHLKFKIMEEQFNIIAKHIEVQSFEDKKLCDKPDSQGLIRCGYNNWRDEDVPSEETIYNKFIDNGIEENEARKLSNSMHKRMLSLKSI